MAEPSMCLEPCLLNQCPLSFLLSEGRQKPEGPIRPKFDGSRGKHSGAKQTPDTWLAPAEEFLDLQMRGGRVGSAALCPGLSSSPWTV